MDVSTLREPLTRTETTSILVAAVVAGVVLGPGAITLADGSSVLLSAISVLAIGALAFVAGALALAASKAVRTDA